MPDQTLPYVSEREYRPAAGLQPKAAATAFGSGLLAVAAVAAAVVAWHLSGLPVIIGVAGVAQGLALGWMLRAAFRRAKLRSRASATVVCVLLAIGANVLTHAALYVRQVYAVRSGVRGDLAGREDESGAAALILNLSERPFEFYDTFVLRPETGRGGLVGFLLSKQGMTVGGKPTRPLGAFVVNGALLIGLTYLTARSQVRRPFCDDCGNWFGPPANATVVPAEHHARLAAAVEAGDPAAAVALNREVAGQDLGAGCAVAQVHRCPGCGHTFADVVVIISGNPDRPVSRLVRVSTAMVQALKSEPVVTVAEQGETPPPRPLND